MTVTRRRVFEALAAETEAERDVRTTKTALAVALGTDEETIDAHLQGLEQCELVRTYADDQTRITITGEELLALDPDDLVIVDTNPRGPSEEGDSIYRSR